MKQLVATMLLLGLTLAIYLPWAQAQNAEKLFGSAKVEMGKKLHEDKNCVSCHAQRVAGGARGFYMRPDRKVHSPNELVAMVAACNAQLGSGLFPEEELDIAAYLNHDYYKFK